MTDSRSASSSEQHNEEIHQNLAQWRNKPALRAVYDGFYRTIARHVRTDVAGRIVELGSGIGNLKAVFPNCLCTDLFANPWIDLVQDAYALALRDGTVSNLILFDVWHHLEFPGTALQEFHRVLAPGGRLILFEPGMGALGFLVYGAFHHEPIGWKQPITWRKPDGAPTRYYSAQGNATRIFRSRAFDDHLRDWKRVAVRRFSAISYVASGGYRGPQLYPTWALPVMRGVDAVCDCLPALFATRLLVVLEKRAA